MNNSEKKSIREKDCYAVDVSGTSILAEPCVHLDHITKVHRQFINLSGIEGFDVLQQTGILLRDKVDGCTLSAETSGTTNSTNQAKSQQLTDASNFLCP